MSHREDLLAGAVRCLREKGYAKTTARDIVAASGTNLASIGYHYGSTEALLNAAVIATMDEFGTEIAQAMAAAGGDEPLAARFERSWRRVIESFRDNPQAWLATFDVLGVAQRDPALRATVSDGIEDGRNLWARVLYDIDPAADPALARAVGSLHQALISGVLVQWLIDPDRAPSAGDLAGGMLAIAGQLCPGGEG
jgi:AcrR family transcriptional regulator